MKKTRRKSDAALKAKIGLEALPEQSKLMDLAQRYQVHVNQIYAWKKQLQDQVVRAFDAGAGRDGEAAPRSIDDRARFVSQEVRKMSAPDRRGLLQRDHESLSIRRQCQLLSVARSSVYRPPQPAHDNEPELMRRIGQLFTASPFLGSRRMRAMLNGEGCRINRKRVQRLMRRMGTAALGPKPRTTKSTSVFPYLLCHMAIDRPNQVWAADIIYVPIGQGFLYLLAIIDWASRSAGLAPVEHEGHIVLRVCARRGLGALRPD